MRLITVELYLCSATYDVNEIAKKIDLSGAVLWYPRLPQYADPAWSFVVHSQDLAIETPLFELQNILLPKMECISEICANKNIYTHINIIVKADSYVERPEISLPPSIFPFFMKLNATIDFDILYKEDLA